MEQQREDYMLNEQLRRQHEEAAQAYLDDLMSSSAPACYLPLLLQLVASPAVVLPLRVCCHCCRLSATSSMPHRLDHPCIAQVLALEAVTAIITLTGKLTQEHHMMVSATPSPLSISLAYSALARTHELCPSLTQAKTPSGPPQQAVRDGAPHVGR